MISHKYRWLHSGFSPVEPFALQGLWSQHSVRKWTLFSLFILGVGVIWFFTTGSTQESGANEI
ncbi:MAG: hypothetical protein U9P70_01830 [Patescibacteria group bacterium]|nr:hypothetical protein [Patescibacteria group bacterium]